METLKGTNSEQIYLSTDYNAILNGLSISLPFQLYGISDIRSCIAICEFAKLWLLDHAYTVSSMASTLIKNAHSQNYHLSEKITKSLLLAHFYWLPSMNSTLNAHCQNYHL